MELNLTDNQKSQLRSSIYAKFRMKGTPIDAQDLIKIAMWATRLETVNPIIQLTLDEGCVMIEDYCNRAKGGSSYPYMQYVTGELTLSIFTRLSTLVDKKLELYDNIKGWKNWGGLTLDFLRKTGLNFFSSDPSYSLSEQEISFLILELSYTTPSKLDFRAILPSGANQAFFTNLLTLRKDAIAQYKKSVLYLDIPIEQRWDIRYSIDNKFANYYHYSYDGGKKPSLSDFNSILLNAIHNPSTSLDLGPLTWIEACVMITDAIYQIDLTEQQAFYDLYFPDGIDLNYWNQLLKTLEEMSSLYEKLKTWGNGKPLSIEDIRKHAKDSSLNAADRLTKEDINLLITDLGYPERVFEYKDFLPKEADAAFFKSLLQENDDEGMVVQPPAGQHIQVPNIIYDWDEEERRITAVATGKGKIKLGIDSYKVDGINIAFKSFRTIPGAKHILTAWYSDNENCKATKEVIIPANKGKYKEKPPVITPKYGSGTLTATASAANKCVLIMLSKTNTPSYVVAVGENAATATRTYSEKTLNKFDAKACVIEQGVRCSDYVREHIEIAAVTHIPEDKKPEIHHDKKDGVLTVTATGNYGVYLKVSNKKNKKDFKEDEKDRSVSVNLSYDPNIKNVFHVSAYSTQKGKRVSDYVNEDISIEPIESPVPSNPKPIIPDKPKITENHDNGTLHITATGDGIVRLEAGGLKDEKKGTAELTISYNPEVDNTFKAVASIMENGMPVCIAEKSIKIEAIKPDPPLITWTAKDGILTVVATSEGHVKLVIGNLSNHGVGSATLSITYKTTQDNTFKAKASIYKEGQLLCTAIQDIKIDAVIPDPPLITWTAQDGTLTVVATGEGLVKLKVGNQSQEGEGTVTLNVSYRTDKDCNYKAKASIMMNKKAVITSEQDIKIDAIIPEPPAIPEPPVITWKAENGTLVVTATGDGQVRVEIGKKSSQGKGTATLELSYETEKDNTFKAKAFIIENEMPVCIAEKDIKIEAIIPEQPAIPNPPVITWKAEKGTLVVIATGEGQVRLEVGKKNDEGDGNANLSIPYDPDIDNIFRAVACIMENGESVNYIQEDISIPALPRQFTGAPKITWKASSGVLTVIATGDGLVRLEVDHLANQGEGRSYLYFYYCPTRNSTFSARACFMDGENRASDYAQKIINIPAEPPKPEIPGGSATGGGNAGGDDPGSGVGGGEGENKLESLDFKYLIGGPLKACVEAQEEAAQATTDYLTSTMLLKDDDIADYKPVMMNFYFERDGIYHELSIPLMTILPVPYMSIEHVDLNFQAMVTFSDKNEGNDKYELKACYPTYTSETKRDTTTQSETSARQNIDIRLRATTTDQPAGVSRLIQILDQELSEIVPIAPKTDTKYPAIKEPVAESPTSNESNIEELISLDPITTDDALESTAIEVKPETDNDSKPMDGIAQLVIPPEKPEAGEALYSYSEVIPPEKPEAGEALYSYSEVIPPTDNATIPGRTVVMPPDDAIDQPKEDQSIVKRPPKRTNRVIKRRAKIDDKNKSDG